MVVVVVTKRNEEQSLNRCLIGRDKEKQQQQQPKLILWSTSQHSHQSEWGPIKSEKNKSHHRYTTISRISFDAHIRSNRNILNSARNLRHTMPCSHTHTHTTLGERYANEMDGEECSREIRLLLFRFHFFCFREKKFFLANLNPGMGARQSCKMDIFFSRCFFFSHLSFHVRYRVSPNKIHANENGKVWIWSGVSCLAVEVVNGVGGFSSFCLADSLVFDYIWCVRQFNFYFGAYMRRCISSPFPLSSVVWRTSKRAYGHE